MRRFAVIGLGNFGNHLSRSLSAQGAEVLTIDRDLATIELTKHEVTRAICFDSTQEKNLKMVSIHEFDAVIVAIGENSIEASIMTTALVAGQGAPWIIARSTSELHSRILKLVGAHEVINPEQFVADRLVQRVTQPNILDLIPISHDGYVVTELLIPPHFVDKTLADLQLRKEFNVNIIGIKQRKKTLLPDGTEQFKEHINHSPGPNDLMHEKDILICIGEQTNIEKMLQDKHK